MSDKMKDDMNDQSKEDANVEELEERALSVFNSERAEDLTALIFCLATTFIVLLFTKWL